MGSDPEALGENMQFRRMILVGAILISGVAAAATPGSAGAATPPTINVDYVVKATTTLAKLHQTVVVPPGTFTGSLNLGTGVLTGVLALPPASTTVNLAGIGLAKATFTISPTKPVIGTVNLHTLAVSSTASFNVLVDSVEPLGLPVNMVGRSCTTSKPVAVTFGGKFATSGSSTFTGDYTIPPLVECGLLTPALNVVIPGPGNVFSASFSHAAS